MPRNYDNEAKAIRAAADMLGENLSTTDMITVIEVLEITLDDLRGKPRPDCRLPPASDTVSAQGYTFPIGKMCDPTPQS